MIEKFKPVITPDVINVLCQEPVFVRQDSPEPEPDFKPKQSFWGRVGNFFGKIVGGITSCIKYICAVVTTAAVALNAYARYKNATRPVTAQG